MLGMISTAKHKHLMQVKELQIKADEQLLTKLWLENKNLRARLAPFTTPRARDSRGRFIKEVAR